MKLRIDAVRVDPAGQIVVSYTVDAAGNLPVEASGQCVVFPSRAAMVAYLRRVDEVSVVDALRLAVIEWRKSDAALANLAAAAGKIGDVYAARGAT